MLFLEFLAVGTWGFWLLLAVAAIVMSELMDTNRPGYATCLAVALVAVFAVFGNFNPLTWIKNNPVDLIEYVVGYFVVGSVWGVAKWFFWLRKIRSVLDEIKALYPNNRDAWASEARRRSWPMELPPKVSDHKTLIIGWMALWPSSMIWTLLHDPVKWVFEEIYANLGGMMQKISNHVFKDFTQP